MKLLFLGIIGLLLNVACGTSNQDFTTGSWVDQDREFSLIEILKEDASFYLKSYSGKALIEAKDQGYQVDFAKTKYPIVYNAQDRTITLGTTVYIPKEESKNVRFLGTWQNKEDQITFNIVTEGGIVWYITRADGTKNVYYPKLNKTGFEFSYNNQVERFTLQESCIVDSKGKRYCKI